MPVYEDLDTERPTTKITHVPITQRIFGIPFDFTSVGTAAGTAYTLSYTISTNFNFMWELTQAVKLDVTTGVQDSFTAPAIRDVGLQIRDEFTSEDMFTNPIFISEITGNGKNQNILPRPYVFRGGSTITLTVTDTFGGAAFRMQIALMG